jgi:hypothetical protein
MAVIPGTIFDVRQMIRRRRSNGWVGLYQRVAEKG